MIHASQGGTVNTCNDIPSLSTDMRRYMNKANTINQAFFQPGGICDPRKFTKPIYLSCPDPKIDEAMVNKALVQSTIIKIEGHISPLCLLCASRKDGERMYDKMSNNYTLTISSSTQNNVSKTCTFLAAASLICKYRQQPNDNHKLQLYKELTDSEVDEKCVLFTKHINHAILYFTTNEKEKLPKKVLAFAHEYNLNLCTDVDTQLEIFQQKIQDKHIDPSELAIYVRGDICKITRTYIALLKNLAISKDELSKDALDEVNLFRGNCTYKEKNICKKALGCNIKSHFPPIVQFLLQFTTGGWNKDSNIWSYAINLKTYDTVKDSCASPKLKSKSTSTTVSPIQFRHKTRETMTPSSRNSSPTKILKKGHTTTDTPVIEVVLAVPQPVTNINTVKSLFGTVSELNLKKTKPSSSQDSKATFKQSLDEEIEIYQDSLDLELFSQHLKNIKPKGCIPTLNQQRYVGMNPDFDSLTLDEYEEIHCTELDMVPSSQDSTKMVSPKTQIHEEYSNILTNSHRGSFRNITFCQNSHCSPLEDESRSSQLNDE